MPDRYMPHQPAADDIRWLTAPSAAALLDEIARHDEPLHTTAARLRKDHPPERVALLLEQRELRRRAAAKFSQADRMYFTRVGLQQATDEATARYKAARFAGRRAVVDACCGVGGDLIALARVAPVVGVDASVAVTLLAEANLGACGCQSGSVLVAEAAPSVLAGCDAWHADPDRRAGGRRTTRVELHSPGEAVLTAMLAAQPNAAIKLAPAGEVPAGWAPTVEQQWISRQRECRQLCVWSGALAEHAGSRRATRIDDDGAIAGDFIATPLAGAPIAEALGESLYEPDPAVLAAELTDSLAQQLGLRRVSRGIGYLTGPGDAAHALLTEYPIADVLPLSRKKLTAYVRDNNVGRLDIKHRGVTIDPDKLRKELKPNGDASATLIAFPFGGKGVVVVSRGRPE